MNYYNKIKNELIDNEIYKRVKDYSKNRYELERYYNVGKLLVEAQGNETRAKYGDELIKEYSRKLMLEIDKKYSYRNLMHMRKYYLLFKNEKLNALRSQLTWTHYRELLTINNTYKIIYYINLCKHNNLSYRELHNKIKSNEYERLGNNAKTKIIESNEHNISDFIKHPILIKNKCNYTSISEKALKQLILEDIPNFMKELGEGYAFIDSEYKIKLGDRYNYIDLLLFNYKYNAFAVIELKVTELRKEHIGQIQVYMNYVDENIKSISHDKTIGIIIAKYGNEFVMRYCSDKRIFNTTFMLV